MKVCQYFVIRRVHVLFSRHLYTIGNHDLNLITSETKKTVSTNDVVVKTETNLLLEATASITLQSGFKAEYGTTISLKIDANLCSSSRGSINFDLTKNDTLSNVVSDSVSVRLPKEDNIYDSNPEVNRIAISPNPSCSGKYEIISEGDKLLSYEVYNAQGIRILRGENNSIIDLSLHANGVYICVVKRLKSLYTIKLIKNG